MVQVACIHQNLTFFETKMFVNLFWKIYIYHVFVLLLVGTLANINSKIGTCLF